MEEGNFFFLLGVYCILGVVWGIVVNSLELGFVFLELRVKIKNIIIEFEDVVML